MRISDFLRASFVGALIFTPAMADEAEQVHEEALRVLRDKLGQSSTSAPATPLTINSADPEAARLRAEREARLKAEARERMAERERLQAERRQQFEQFVKERERLRQEQRAYDTQVARQIGQIRESEYNEVHSRALEALHQAQHPQQQPAAAVQPVQPTPGGAPGGVVSEAEVAPRLIAQARPSSSALSSSTQSDNSDVHAKALEVLRQSQAGVSTSTTVVGSADDAPKPSPELQRRLKEMQAELEQEQLQKRNPSSSSALPEGYLSDLERRAKESSESGAGASVVSTPAPTVKPAGLDSTTREIIERQNREISRGLATPAPAVASPAPAVVKPARAPIVTPAPAPQVSAVTHTTASETTGVQYSKELEERARQILLERAQTVQTAPVETTVTTTSPAPAITAPPAAAVSAATAATETVTRAPQPVAPIVTSATPVTTSVVTTEVQSGDTSSGPKTKMQRLKDLTDLYRADKIGPAEYHQKRAQILAEPQ